MHAYRDQYAKLFRNGQNVVLVTVSADPADTLAAWARDDQFQWLFASDTGGVAGKRYGAYNGKYKLDNRSLFVIGPDGKIAYRQVPFREIDPTAYTELAAALDQIVGAAPGGR
jgi:peroxiredoxin